MKFFRWHGKTLSGWAIPAQLKREWQSIGNGLNEHGVFRNFGSCIIFFRLVSADTCIVCLQELHVKTSASSAFHTLLTLTLPRRRSRRSRHYIAFSVIVA